MSSTDAVLTQILAQLEAMQLNQQAMQAKVCHCLVPSGFYQMKDRLMRWAMVRKALR